MNTWANIAAVAVFVSTSVVSAADSSEVRFSVRRAGENAGVPHVGAALYQGGHHVGDGVTDDRGEVAFRIPGPGDYRIVFRRGECLPVTRNLSFPLSNDAPIEVKLPATATIETVVRRSDENWSPMAGEAVVTVGRARDLRRSPDNWYPRAVAKQIDENGRAVFCVRSGQAHDVIVKHPDYAHAARYGIIPSADRTELVEISVKPRVLSCPRIKGR